ncbi:MAG: DUF2207 domain-containing protein [Bauldia sp.]|uniref:DUF2207 domain-containing protein n=1 Tax=Bauldia sp. TaxID=2575872 RepID=UPI001DBB72B8|nr:DUF2207 domain-containing protein [Bauldia sp.]MCB1497902.1 DUF2207 domain-containing protein [Bauldia sp.]
MRALLAGLAAALLVVSVPAAAEEVIERFDANVEVRPDGVLDVVETIRVHAEGTQIRHGIFRDVPLTFVDENDNVHKVSFSIREITRDGRPEPYHTASNSEGIRIYVGDGDIYLDPGTYTYRIHYETGRQIRFLPEHTELFWNVTGNDWSFPILEATALFTLPDNRAPVRWTAYTGRYGEEGKAVTGEITGDDSLRVTTTATLPPREGLSVVLQIPDGLVSPPSGMQAFHYWFLDNRRFLLGGIGLVGVLVFYLISWNAVGRDPPRGTIIPLFHPPSGISPALAGYVRDFGWSGGWREFTAAALSLATKGLLIFNDSGGDIVLSRTETPKPAAKLPPGENAIFNWVAGKGGKVTIDKANGKSLASAFSRFKSAVEGENRNRFFRRNLGYFVVGLILTALVCAGVLFFGDLPDAEIGLLVASVMVGVFLGVFIIPLVRALFGPRKVGSIFAIGFNLLVLGFIGFGILSTFGNMVSSLPTGFGESVLSAIARNGFPLVLVGGFAAMNGIFFYLLRAPTAAGRAVMDQIEGLELYIRTAESERMNYKDAPDLDTGQFERLLPYAVALDVEKPWSEAFETAFARTNPGKTVTSSYNPVWHGGHGWSGHSFASSVASTVSSAQSSFASSIPAPKSSSSGFSGGGGGGGSGGGGGGGGGGGW